MIPLENIQDFSRILGSLVIAPKHTKSSEPISLATVHRENRLNVKRTLGNSREKEDKNKEERIYIGVNEADEETWGKVDTMLDSGCKTTVCGEL